MSSINNLQQLRSLYGAYGSSAALSGSSQEDFYESLFENLTENGFDTMFQQSPLASVPIPSSPMAFPGIPSAGLPRGASPPVNPAGNPMSIQSQDDGSAALLTQVIQLITQLLPLMMQKNGGCQ